MATVNRVSPFRRTAKEPADEAVVQAAKAVFDVVVEKLPGMIKGLLGPALDEAAKGFVSEERLGVAVEEALAKELLGRFGDAVRSQVEGQVKARERRLSELNNIARDLEGHVKNFDVDVTVAASRAMAKEFDGRVEEFGKGYDARLDVLAGRLEGQEKLLNELKAAHAKELADFDAAHERILLLHEKTLGELREFLKALPAPQVTVPEAAIKMVVEQVPSVVNVAPQVSAPAVNFTVPSRRVTKSISYDEYGRPSQVIEHEQES